MGKKLRPISSDALSFQRGQSMFRAVPSRPFHLEEFSGHMFNGHVINRHMIGGHMRNVNMTNNYPPLCP